MTIATITMGPESSELAAGARSYVYRMLATAFSYPGTEFLHSLATGEWSRQLAELARRLPFALSVPVEAPGPADGEALQQSYVSIFEVGTGRPFCSLYEGSHRSGRMKLMEDLVRFYEHFGLKIEAGDHPDHLSAELEFLHYLAFKEAAALAHGDPVADVRRAQRDFLDRHLCRWLPRLRVRLAAASELPRFYAFAADFTERYCAGDLRWLKEA